MKKKSAPPDDAFEGPGFRMIRRGRYLEVKTHRSPEEQLELNRRMHESRPSILANIERQTSELRELIRKYTSLDVVANLLLCEVSHDPDKYVESESKLRPHWVEHATVLQLIEPKFELKRRVVVEVQDIEKVHKLLEEIFMQTTMYYLAEAGNPDRSGPPTKIEELRFATLLHGMSVRSPAYSSHWRDVLVGLFTSGGGIEWLSRKHHLDIQTTLAIIDGIEKHIVKTLEDRIRQARDARVEFSQRLTEYKRTGVFKGKEHEKETFDRVRNMRNKDAKRYLIYVLTEWARVALGTMLSFTVAQIAELSGVTVERVEAFLNVTSIKFGVTLTNILPAPVNVLHERPIVNYENIHYFCSVPHLLTWAVKPALERVLSSGPNWNAYQKHRSSYLVDTAIKYLRNVLSASISYQNLFYPLEDGQETELDALVLFDRYIFLIEGKAGSLGKARRGGKEKIKTQLDALVGDAAEQVDLADRYIRETNVPEFRLKNGKLLTIDKCRYTERVLITVTLDVLDIFTADMYQMRDIGVVKTHDLPWCIALTDLRAISEILIRPYEFTHYLRWRISVIADPKLHGGKDELNWLAVYLKEGPVRPRVPDNFTDLSFTSYTDDFDAYFLHKEGYKTIPAARPSQPIPKPIDNLCEQISNEGNYRFTELCECLLDLHFEERNKFAQKLRELVFKESQGKKDAYVFEGTDIVLKVYSSSLSIDELNKEASVLHKENGKRTVAISLTSIPDWSINAWTIVGPENTKKS
jgi:hypothetical protein